MLRSMRYGEADRILHLYTPDRGRVGAIAKGVRRTRSRFGGRLEPFFRLDLVLHEGRGDLLTVTGAETRRRPRAPARATAPRSTRAARACDAVGAAVRDRRAAPRGLPPALQRARAARRRARAGDARATSSRSGSSCCSPPGFAPQLAACASCGEREHLTGFSRRGRRRGLRRLRGVGASRSTRRRTSSWSARSARRSPRRPDALRARAAPGRARDRARPSSTTRRPTCAPQPRDRIARHGGPPVATKWVYDFAEGSREMRDLLGGKGANVAEMTRILGAERVPAGFTITTEACVAYMRDGAESPTGLDEQVAEALARLEEQAGKRLGDAERPAARLGALAARASRCRACSTPSSTSASTTSRSQGLARADRQRALRLGLLPALRADVRQRRARASRASASRTRSSALKERARRQARHRARRRRAARARRHASRASTATRPRGLPAGPAGAAARARSARCSTRGRASAPSPTGASTASPTTGAPRSTSSRWCSATRARRSGSRRRVQPRRGHRRARAVAATSCVNAQGEDVVSGVRNTRDIAELARRACPRPTRS